MVSIGWFLAPWNGNRAVCVPVRVRFRASRRSSRRSCQNGRGYPLIPTAPRERRINTSVHVLARCKRLCTPRVSRVPVCIASLLSRRVRYNTPSELRRRACVSTGCPRNWFPDDVHLSRRYYDRWKATTTNDTLFISWSESTDGRPIRAIEKRTILWLRNFLHFYIFTDETREFVGYIEIRFLSIGKSIIYVVS